MTQTDIYKTKPKSFFTQRLEEFASKRDKVLYTEKDIDIYYIENKIGIFVIFENLIEKRYIENSIIPSIEPNNNNTPKLKLNDKRILNPWECEIINEVYNEIKERKKISNKFILFDENKKCDSCNGTGRLLCHECDGTGKILNNELLVNCNECEGKGFFICDVCNGLGNIKKVTSLVQEISSEKFEKTFIIDEMGGIQVLHRRLNTDIDYLDKLSYDEIKKGGLRKVLNKISITKEVSENFLLSIIPYLGNQQENTRNTVENIKIYSFPISLVNCKIGGKNDEIYIFTGKDYDLIQKEEIFKHSSEHDKEFQILSADLYSEKEEENSNKNHTKFLYLWLAITVIITSIIFIFIFFLFIQPNLNTTTNNFINPITSNSLLHEFQPPQECSIIDTKEKLDTIFDLAETYVENDSISYAISTYKYIADCFGKSDIQKENIHLYKRIAELYTKLSKEKESIDYYKKGFIIAKENDLIPEQALFSYIIGDLEFKVKNFKQAGVQYKLSAELYKRLNDKAKEMQATLKSAEAYIKLEDSTTEAYLLLNYTLQEAEKMNNKELLAKSLLYLAEIEIIRGIDTKRTEDYLEQANKVISNDEDRAKLNFILGKYYYRRYVKKKDKNEILKSENYYIIAAQLYNDLENIDMMASTLNSIGIIYIELGKYEEAEERLLMVKSIREKDNSRADLAIALFNLANLKERKGEINEAINYMKKVVKIDEELNLKYLENDKEYLNKLKSYLNE